MSSGRIHAVLISTKAGNVIYERFYDPLDEATRAEIRGAFHGASQPILMTVQDGQQYVGNYRGAPIVFMPTSDIIIYSLGSGEYNELALAQILQAIIRGVSDVLGKPASEALLFEGYAQLCLTIDEVINEGMLETVNKDIVRKGTKMKVPWESR
ncbi:hypothetical protein BSKO_05427 [Bryopsis sp. KO-2023]|nr:hypothetical protein BSKO_05427 [Bryopsis sp. KO-2023]